MIALQFPHTINCTEPTPSAKAVASQLASCNLLNSDEMGPAVAMTIVESALDMNSPSEMLGNGYSRAEEKGILKGVNTK